MVRGDQPIQLENIEAVNAIQGFFPVQRDSKRSFLREFIAESGCQVYPNLVGTLTEAACGLLLILRIIEPDSCNIRTRRGLNRDSCYIIPVRITTVGHGNLRYGLAIHSNLCLAWHL